MWKKRVLFDVLHACYTLHPNPHIKSSLTDIGRAHMDIADVVGLELTSPSVAEKGMAERKDGEGKQSRKKSFEAPYIPDNRNHLLFYLFSFFFFVPISGFVTQWRFLERIRRMFAHARTKSTFVYLILVDMRIYFWVLVLCNLPRRFQSKVDDKTLLVLFRLNFRVYSKSVDNWTSLKLC